MNGKKREEDVIQNLVDAGCAAETINVFMECIRDGEIDEGLKILASHRLFLLENFHNIQKKIDCLDYLTYSLRKKTRRGTRDGAGGV